MRLERLFLLMLLGWLCSIQTGFAAKPAIDLDGYGVVRFFTSAYETTDVYVLIRDYDGFSANGDSHTVTVQVPGGGTYNLPSQGAVDSSTHAYGQFFENPMMPAVTGDYIITVTDPEMNTAQATDTVTIDSAFGIPDETSFTPVSGTTVSDTTPTFSWDPVTNAKHYRVRIFNTSGGTVWRGVIGSFTTTYTVPPGVLAPHTTYKYRVDARDSHFNFDIDNYSKGPHYNSLNLSFTTGPSDDAPFIDHDHAGVMTWYNERFGEHFTFWIKVHDAQGSPDDIKSVTVTTPDNVTYDLYHYRQESSTRSVYHRYVHGNILSGNYLFKVTDKSGHTGTYQEYLDANSIGSPDSGSITGVLSGTSLAVDWPDVTGAAFYRLEVFDQDFNRIYIFATTDSQYTIPEGFLKAGELYHYTVRTRREFIDENTDNGSSAFGTNFDWQTVVPEPDRGTNDPMIDLDNWGVALWRLPNWETPSPGDVYWLSFAVKVTDADGCPGNNHQVEVTYPDGTTTARLIPDRVNSSNEMTFWQAVQLPQGVMPAAGTYTFTVTDEAGNTDSITDDLVISTIDLPQIITPTNGTSTPPCPVFKWHPVTNADNYRVRVYEGVSRTHHSEYTADSSYRIPCGTLDRNGLYHYRIYAYNENYPTVEVDNLSSTEFYHGDQPNFVTDLIPLSPIFNILME